MSDRILRAETSSQANSSLKSLILIITCISFFSNQPIRSKLAWAYLYLHDPQLNEYFGSSIGEHFDLKLKYTVFPTLKFRADYAIFGRES